jgi:transcriptional antiterminator RfaH
MKEWYVLYTKPRNEKKVDERLHEKGFETYCPVIFTIKQWSDRKKKVMLPMFPSYIFIKVEEHQRVQVLSDPGVLNFVFWQGEPAKVRPIEIYAIKKIAEEGQSIQVESNQLNLGENLVIPNGPFKGLIGIVDAINDKIITITLKPLGCVVKFQL